MASTGLVAFDGTDWTIWDMETSSIPTNHLKSVVVDAENHIWMATQEEGLLFADLEAVGIHSVNVVELPAYPNPADAQVILPMKQDGYYSWTFRDLQGHSVMYGTLAGSILLLDTKRLPDGVYFLEINSEQTGTESTRIIVSH
jgi:hypothetical protein